MRPEERIDIILDNLSIAVFVSELLPDIEGIEEAFDRIRELQASGELAKM